MNLKNSRAFLQELRICKESGQVKFAAGAFFVSGGTPGVELSVTDVKDVWIKSLMGVDYHPVYYARAQNNGYVNSVNGKVGKFVLTEEGVEVISNLTTNESILPEIKKTGNIYIVNKKGSHSFDKLLLQIFSSAKKEIFVADSYINDGIFFHLDVIPKDALIKLIYKKVEDLSKFQHRANKFRIQYSKFEVKNYKHLHDRFIVVDGIGYVLGPSIKDAAEKSPAVVVRLNSKETSLLADFFKTLWKSLK